LLPQDFHQQRRSFASTFSFESLQGFQDIIRVCYEQGMDLDTHGPTKRPQRIGVRINARLKFGAGLEAPIQILNLSYGGVGVQLPTDSPLKPGMKIVVEFPAHGELSGRAVEAQIVWRELNRAGLKFLADSSQDEYVFVRQLYHRIKAHPKAQSL
jgi:hypothetical protein